MVGRADSLAEPKKSWLLSLCPERTLKAASRRLILTSNSRAGHTSQWLESLPNTHTGLDLQHFLNQVWWYTPIMPFGWCRQRGQEFKIMFSY